jgi:hypothetical protein
MPILAQLDKNNLKNTCCFISVGLLNVLDVELGIFGIGFR